MMSQFHFEDFLFNISFNPLRILDAFIVNSKYVHLDLSDNNTELLDVNVDSSKHLETYIFNYIKRYNALVAFGGYNERRTIYKRSSYFNLENKEERNIHLGIDLWCEANTQIFAPLDATVHSFKNNTNYGDYGPTIILKHSIEGVIFYTLYGHLSLASIQNLEVGTIFKQGDYIANLGDASVNGNYPPHLHFQIIKALQGFEGDYPGVCSKTDLDFYLNNCPDPNLLLKLK